jgi:hypothetical protein
MKKQQNMASMYEAIGGAIELETKREFYQNQVKNAVDELNQPNFHKLVESGAEGSITKRINIPLGYLTYWPKNTVESGDIIFQYWHIQNSPYNRDPFLTDEATLVSKLAYIIRYLYGVAGFNLLPASIISNPINKPDASIMMSNCILSKDRGHFMTVWHEYVTLNKKVEKGFWKKVINRLTTESKKYASTLALKELIETNMLERIDSLTKKGVKSFSLQDLIPSNYYNKIYTKEETIEISLETLETHRSEIIKINNDDNKWRPHNYGIIDLSQRLIYNPSWGYNPYLVDSMCSESELCNGNYTMLKAVRGNDYSGFQTEVLLVKACSDIKYDSKSDFSTHLLYKEYAGCNASDRGNLYDLIFTNKITTDSLKSTLENMETIASNKIWETVQTTLETAKTEYEKRKYIHSNSIDKLSPKSIDTGLLYIRMVEDVMTTLKARGSVFSIKEYTELVGNYIIETIKDYDTFFHNVNTTTKSWKGRYDNFFNTWFTDIVKIETDTLGSAGSESSIKKLHLISLRTKASEAGLPMEFEMYDRRSQNAWEKVMINLNTGDGLHLCHIKASKNMSIENTFMGPALDNGYQSNKNLTKDYLNKTFFKEFEESIDLNRDNKDAWINTERFCKINVI